MNNLNTIKLGRRMSKMKTRVANLDACHENDGYEKFEQSIRKSMKAFGDVPLFQTNVNDLWDLYLTNIPKDSRQYYNCNACRKFIERYGGLVTISPGGETHSVMWQGDDVPGMFKASVEAMRQAIGKAKVTGVFLSKDELLGTPVTGEWTHMHAILPSAFQERLHTVDEVMAEKTADFILLKKVCAHIRLRLSTKRSYCSGQMPSIDQKKSWAWPNGLNFCTTLVMGRTASFGIT